MAPLCNVGLCFNPCAQQKIFCQGSLALAGSQGSAPAGSRTHTASASSASLCLTCPAPPKKQTHPLGGFSSRRFLRKSLTPFPWGSPASPRFPLGLRPHPFSPKLSRFRACSFVAAETAPAPSFSQSLLWGVSLQSRARRKAELEYSQGFSLGPALPFTRNSLSSAANLLQRTQ